MFSRSPSDTGTQSSTKPALAEPGRCAAKCCEIGVPGIRRSPCSATSVPANLPPPLATLLKKKKKRRGKNLWRVPTSVLGIPVLTKPQAAGHSLNPSPRALGARQQEERGDQGSAELSAHVGEVQSMKTRAQKAQGTARRAAARTE